MRRVEFYGRLGTVIRETVGMVTVQWDDGSSGLLLKEYNVTFFEQLEVQPAKVGRPRQHTSNAEKQRAYRERKKALRN
jgi:hypothetical protein